MDTINKGSIEYLPVLVSDRLENLTSLDGYTIHYRITDVDEVEKQGWTTCTSTGMTVLPLIDTTSLDEGNYKLWIKIDITPETPILGPFDFGVS